MDPAVKGGGHHPIASSGRGSLRRSFDRALLHAARANLSAAALVEEMAGEKASVQAKNLTDLVLRLDDIISEARLARAELWAIRPCESYE
jgi:hypothetical protein